MRTKSNYTLCVLAIFFANIVHTASAQWVKQNTPMTEAIPYYLATPDINTLWTWTRSPVPDSANPKKVEFYQTGDGGRTYRKGTLLPRQGEQFVHIEPMNGRKAHMLTASNAGEYTFQRTVDSGATWQMMPLKPTTFPNVVYFWDDNNGILSCDPDSLGMVVLYTIDGGNTFQRLPQTNLPRINAAEEFGVMSEFQVIGNTIFMAVLNFVTGEDRYWRSLDRGRNWTSGVSFSNNSVFTSRISFSDNNNGMVLRGIGTSTIRPLYTTNGGATWTEAEGDMPSYAAWAIDNIPNTNTFVSMFQDTVKRILYTAATNDFGKTWNSRTDLVPYILDSSFVQFGAPAMAFTNLNILSNNAAWGRFTPHDVYRYQSATPIVAEKPDLDLTITADNNGLSLWNSVKFTLTIRNRGMSRATGVRVNWLPPYKRTPNGTGAFAHQAAYASKGRYDDWNGIWTLPDLQANESATVTFHLFVVNNSANVTQTAQITACNESDLDSAPNNMGGTTPKEDDETSFTSVRAATFDEPLPNSSTPLLALKISPNPAKDKAFIMLNDKNDAAWSVEVVNSIGQVVFSKKEQRNGLLELNTEGYKNGLYLVHLTNGVEKRIEKLMVQH